MGIHFLSMMLRTGLQVQIDYELLKANFTLTLEKVTRPCNR